MYALIRPVIFSLRTSFQTRAALHAEIIALRHQLLVLQRRRSGHRTRICGWDRFLWVGSNDIRLIGDLHFASSSHRRLSPGIGRDSASNRLGGVVTKKAARQFLPRFAISSEEWALPIRSGALRASRLPPTPTSLLCISFLNAHEVLGRESQIGIEASTEFIFAAGIPRRRATLHPKCQD
jgi:hypothetical protein